MALLLEELGGTARRRDLLAHGTSRALTAALANGSIVRIGRGRYALAREPGGEAAAHEASGILSHASAAEWYGWSLKHPPDRAVVTVPRHRKVPRHLRERIDIRYADLPPSSINGIVTSPATTVVACSRSMPFDEALCIADSALRCGHVDGEGLRAEVEASPRTGRARARRVVAAADARSANAFESAVRAISLDVDGLRLEPQVRIAPSLTPDLVDHRLRIVVECDSWTFHAEKSAFHRDLARYNRVGLDGWLLLRFDRRHAMDEPDYVREVLSEAVATRS